MFLFILIIIFLIAFVILFNTTIELHLHNINYFLHRNEKIINKNHIIVLKFLIFNKIKFLELNLSNIKLEKNKLKQNLQKVTKKIQKPINKLNIKKLKNLHLEIKQLDFKIEIGTKDPALTGILVGLVSTTVSIIIANFLKQNELQFWQVTPIYQNENLFKINLNCIISLKLIHIIYTVFKIKLEEKV